MPVALLMLSIPSIIFAKALDFLYSFYNATLLIWAANRAQGVSTPKEQVHMMRSRSVMTSLVAASMGRWGVPPAAGAGPSPFAMRLQISAVPKGAALRILSRVMV